MHCIVLKTRIVFCIIQCVYGETCYRYNTLCTLVFLHYFPLHQSLPLNLLPWVHFCPLWFHLLKTHSRKHGYALFACTFEWMTLCMCMNVKYTFYFVMFPLVNYNHKDAYQWQQNRGNGKKNIKCWIWKRETKTECTKNKNFLFMHLRTHSRTVGFDYICINSYSCWLLVHTPIAVFARSHEKVKVTIPYGVTTSQNIKYQGYWKPVLYILYL